MSMCEICRKKTSRLGGQKREFRAKFPLDEERCKQWVAATGNEDLVYVPIEKLHQLKYICGKHFRAKDFRKKKTRLRNSAIPSVDIAAKPLSDDILKDFPLHVYYSNETRDIPVQDHNYCRRIIERESTPCLEMIPTIHLIRHKESNSSEPTTPSEDEKLISTSQRIVHELESVMNVQHNEGSLSSDLETHSEINNTAMSDDLKCKNCNIVVNELLAYIRNVLVYMNEESIKKICSTCFSTEDILTAKILLYNCLPSAKTIDLDLSEYVDSMKVPQDLIDIIYVMKNTKEELLPIFVAKELHKLPPLTTWIRPVF